jgi:FMN-dependent NADH-azoreductase
VLLLQDGGTICAEGTAGDWEAAVQRACAKIDDGYDHFAV